jgi:hypothetical protein
MYRILRRPVLRRTYSSIVPPGRRASVSSAFLRGAGYATLLCVGGYAADREFNASTITRNLRTFWTVRRVLGEKRVASH